MFDKPEETAQSPEEMSQEDRDKAELASLKKRADQMGIKYSNNIGVDALKAKIAAAMEGQKPTSDNSPQAEARQAEQAENGNGDVNALTGKSTKPTKKLSLRQYLINEKMKLVRVRITNLDPKKKDLPGEIITVANEYLGTVRKFVPFGEVTDDGYHVPYCIYKYLKARKFLNIRVIKDKTGRGNDRVESNYVPEFALEVLPPLTEKEIKQLAQAQIAAGSVG